jgi:hypothetical protein
MSTIAEKTIQCFPGATSVASADIAYVIPLEIALDNKAFDIVTGAAPGNREAQYIAGSGKVKFADPFPGTPANDLGRSKVYIKYKL